MDLISRVNTLADLPGVVSAHSPSKTALVVDDAEITYADIEKESNRIANALIRHGVGPGDRVAYLGKDSRDSVMLVFGVAKANAVIVNINWRLAAEEVAYILSDAAPTLFFVDGEFSDLIARLHHNLPAERIVAGSVSRWCGASGDDLPGVACAATDVVAQIYTSGTTGRPKGVRLSSRSFLALAHEMDAQGDPWIGLTDTSVTLICVPTFHVAGIWQLVRALAAGSTTVLIRTFDPAAVLRAIARHRVTITGMVPAMLHVMLMEPACASADLSSLEAVVYGGSPVSPALLQRAMHVFGCEFYQIYGLTETGNMAVCLRPADHVIGGPRRLRAAGRPLPGVKVRVLDRDRNSLGPGAIGEIAIRSPANMAGYWNLPDATRETLVDGWVMTGDAGYVDEDGFVYVCDRIKDMIIAAGENIYPVEIENVIRGHQDVADVAVIGVPDDLWGEAVTALVVRKPGSAVRATDLTRHIRGQLAEFKVPKSIDFVDGLPRNAAGKVLKMKLREPYWEGRERRVN
jgi:long-chain acyl-CoA synthetase